MKQLFYSPVFREFIGDNQRLSLIVAGAGAGHKNFRTYELTRFFISRAIHRDGTILDIGCANGFLMRCLGEWAGRRLVPYGLDKDKTLIAKAKRLFPRHAAHFSAIDVSAQPDFAQAWPEGRFDFIYWNVWDGHVFETAKQVGVLRSCFKLIKPGGRVILGFYESDRQKSAKLKTLRRLGFVFTSAVRNPYSPDKSEIVVWSDKSVVSF